MSNGSNRIKSFDGLRVLLAISIFLNHCSFWRSTEYGMIIFERLFHNGQFAVTIFFMLSGYGIYKGYGNKLLNYSFRGHIEFLLRRIDKFFMLYTVTMLYAAFFYIVQGESIVRTFIKFCLAETMLQTLTIQYWGILNSAAWYISSLFVLHIITPWIIKYVARSKRGSLSKILCQLFFILLMDILRDILIENSFISEATGTLLTYVFPVYWIPVYTIGMILAKEKTNEIQLVWPVNSLIEFGVCGISICVYLVGINGPVFIRSHKAIGYAAISALILMTISKEKGCISTLLGKTPLVLLSKYSMPFYLIHFCVIYFGGKQVLAFLSTSTVGLVLESIILFIITSILSYLWVKLERYLRLNYRKEVN